MITSLLTSSFYPRRMAAQVSVLVGLAGLAAFSSSQALMPSIDTNGVAANDPFSIEVVGFNSSFPTQNIYLILPTLTPTFGATTPYANDALGGQTLTVSSFETTNGGVTTDTFSFSVPTNFVPAGTKDNGGHALDTIQFSIGNYFGGTNTVDLTLAGTSFNATASVIFKLNNVTTTGSALATVTPSNGNKSYSAFGQTNSPVGSDISNNQVTTLSLSITYAAVPEPSTNAAILLGAAGLVGTMVVRNRRRARA